MSAPARLMCGARCERVVIERGSEFSIRLAGQVAVVRVRDLKAGVHGEIYADLDRVT